MAEWRKLAEPFRVLNMVDDAFEVTILFSNLIPRQHSALAKWYTINVFHDIFQRLQHSIKHFPNQPTIFVLQCFDIFGQHFFTPLSLFAQVATRTWWLKGGGERKRMKNFDPEIIGRLPKNSSVFKRAKGNDFFFRFQL